MDKINCIDCIHYKESPYVVGRCDRDRWVRVPWDWCKDGEAKSGTTLEGGKNI